LGNLRILAPGCFILRVCRRCKLYGGDGERWASFDLRKSWAGTAEGSQIA
jgi:hypothetical protein